MTTVLAKIQLRRGTAAEWSDANTILSAGEFGVELDTLRFKYGDGSTAWNDLPYANGLFPNGSRGSPNAVTAAGGISTLDMLREIQFVSGSPGAVIITKNPQVAVGTVIGQELILKGTSNTNTVTLSNGTGLELNGPCPLRNGSMIWLVWDGTVWGEVSRNGT